MDTNTLPRLLTVKEAANQLHLSASMIYKLVEHREIPCIRIGTQIRFNQAAIQGWLEQKIVDVGGL